MAADHTRPGQLDMSALARRHNAARCLRLAHLHHAIERRFLVP
jgi:hypothetical protein